MEIHDLRGMTDEELSDELDSTYRELMNLRFRMSTMQLSNVREIGKARKRIARTKTLIKERELARN